MQLRWYQHEACDAAWDSLLSRRGNPLIDLPTGSGKSWVLAEIARKAVSDYAGRVVVLAHRKELLRQNADKITKLCDIPTGIYSAGLGSRESQQDIIVGGIQSIYAKASELGRRHLVIIDEAHLTPQSDDGMYRQFLSDLGKYNPNLKIVGLTATPYRLDSGKLWGKDELFNHVCYRGDIRRLIAEGHLCNLTNKPSDTKYDTSSLNTRMGEFVRRQVEDLFGNKYLIAEACKELIQKSSGRNSILVFCSGVSHAHEVADTLESLTGERVDCVTGDTEPVFREASLADYSSGLLRWLVNVDVLTTGFDAPGTDCVAIMRATQSPGLFCQMVGRGLRVAESKKDCLIVDYGNNLKLHGPIDAVEFGTTSKSKAGATSDAPSKVCPGCDESVGAGTRECECGFIFQINRKDHEAAADTESQILSEPVTFQVTNWVLNRHYKKDNPDAPNTLRVSYFTEGNMQNVIEEWVCLNHEGFAFKKAAAWWKEHTDEDLDESCGIFGDGVGAALEAEQLGLMRMPTEVTAIQQGRWWRITGRVLGELQPKVVYVDDEGLPF